MGNTTDVPHVNHRKKSNAMSSEPHNSSIALTSTPRETKDGAPTGE